MRTSEQEKTDEEFILKFLHLIYDLWTKGDTRWQPETETLEKRKYRCKYTNEWPFGWGGTRTLCAFETLLGKKLQTSSLVDEHITLSNCLTESLKLAKAILFNPNLKEEMPNQYYLLTGGGETKYYNLHYETRQLLLDYYNSIEASASPNHNDEDVQILQRIKLAPMISDKTVSCHLNDIITQTTIIINNNNVPSDKKKRTYKSSRVTATS